MLVPVRQNGAVAEADSRFVPQGKTRVPGRMKKKRARGRSERLAPVSFGPPIHYVKIPAGEQGTEATLRVMKKLVFSPWGHRHPEVVQLARMIREDVKSKDYRGEAEAIFRFAHIGSEANIKYRLDPSGLEWVQTPYHTLLVAGEGDCDDASVAICALAAASGFQCAFRTVKGDAQRTDQWSHVYAVIGIPAKGGKTEWLSADSTQSEAFLGWNPPEGKSWGMKTWVLSPDMEDLEWD